MVACEVCERRRIMVCGVVQGVGFRPFVHELASRYGLAGFVRNESGQVCIEIEGQAAALDHFTRELTASPPPLAKIEVLDWLSIAARGDRAFQIVESAAQCRSEVFVAHDAATCDACLKELFDPRDRRYGYPFLNCTNCGPRLTIIQGAPYDRPRTTMAAFEMCGDCRREYEDPNDRRFHAQPIACPRCGPRVCLLNHNGESIESSDHIAALADLLPRGQIAAIKGLGGYHLACDATNQAAVAQLRRRKHRERKPLAVMVADIEVAQQLCELSDEERALLHSPRAPIVLLRRKSNHDVTDEVMPGNPSLGVMLPYTPLHHVLMRRFASAGGRALVMTSGNRTDEPIAIDNDDALRRLRGIADVFLTHERPINVRCDDSVMRVVDGTLLPVRRSRGYAPEPLKLPMSCPAPILAVGGQMKNTFALGRDRYAFLSQHMGDLDHYHALLAFKRDITLFEDLFSIQPQAIVHDMHPDYASTHYALERSATEGLRTIAVQHHHAHVASCMAEHRLTGPVIGVTFDGTGYGTDGTIWGGEFLVGGYDLFTRAAHLRPIAMPGGEQAIREPWRMAAAHLLDAGLDLSLLRMRIAESSLKTVQQMLARKINCPLTSSAGRLFDAVSSICGLNDRVAYDGQAAMELEWAADRQAPMNEDNHSVRPFSFAIAEEQLPASERSAFNLQSRLMIDTRPLIQQVAEEITSGSPVAILAHRFHITIACMIADICRTLAGRTGVNRIVLSGGVFMNVLLLRETRRRLADAGLQVFSHHQVPANDGGLSLGQLAVAAARVPEMMKEMNEHVPGHSRSSD